MVFIYKPLSEKRNLCTLVKFIAALLVVNGHLFLFGRSQMEFMVPFMDVGACCVSLFFFFSGYGLMASFRSKGSAYLKNFGTRRLVRLIIPLLTAYCVSLIVYAWLVRPIDWQNVFSTLLWGGPYLRYSWYVTEIIVVYFLFYITMKLPIEQKHRLLALSALIVILMVSLYLARQPIWYIESLPGFIMGIWWEFYERRIGKKLTYSSVCTIAVISFCVWFVMWQWMLIGAPYLPAWRYALLAVLLADISFVVVVCAMIALSRFTPPHILPMRSFYEIYLIQNCVMILAGNISGQFFVKWSLTLFGVVVMGTLLYLINQRISTLMTPQRKVTAEA